MNISCVIFIVKTFILKEFKAFYVSAVLSLQFHFIASIKITIDFHNTRHTQQLFCNL